MRKRLPIAAMLVLLAGELGTPLWFFAGTGSRIVGTVVTTSLFAFFIWWGSRDDDDEETMSPSADAPGMRASLRVARRAGAQGEPVNRP